MDREKELVTIDELMAGTAQFDEEIYIKTDSGLRLRDDLSEKINAAAKQRWENGGKEIHDKWMADPSFAETEEFKNYMVNTTSTSTGI